MSTPSKPKTRLRTGFFVGVFDAAGADAHPLAVDLFALEIDALDFTGLNVRVADVIPARGAAAANCADLSHRYI